MTGEWLELDLTPAERKRAEVIADREGVTVEDWCSRLIRADIVLSENLGATLAKAPNRLDTRNQSQENSRV
jgi:hypothetical protein